MSLTRDVRVRAAAVLVLLLAIFFARPLMRIRDSHYCFADFVQSFSVISVEPGRPPANKEMGDPAVAFLPWLLFTRDQLREGQIPLWNPYNGGGIPLLANYQSAVFSPFALPFYALPLKLALILAPASKLFAIGLFTFLFLRRLDLSPAAALAGAVAHTFGGYYLVWLSGPHSGAAATLPAAFYCAERIAQAREAGLGLGRVRGPTVGLAASLAAGLLAGHPETWYAGFVLLAAFCVFRLRAAWRGYLPLVLAGMLAVATAAVQLVPFAEYLAHSGIVGHERGVEVGRFALPARAGGLLLFPQALGNATDAHDLALATQSGFAETAARHLGAFVTLLAIASAAFAFRSPRFLFFLVASLLWMVCAWNPFGLAALSRVVPLLSLLPVVRTNGVFLFAVSCLAAFAIDALEPRLCPGRARRGLLVGVLALAASGALGLALLDTGLPMPAHADRLRSALRAEVAWFVLPSLAGLLALVLMARWRGTPARTLATALLVAVIYLQGGHRLRDFNPTIEDRLVYPRTGAMEILQGIVGRSRLAVAGSDHDTLVPNSNLPYAIAQAGALDAIWVRRYDALYRRFFGTRWPRNATRIEEQGLRLFGVEYVLTDWPLPNAALVEAQRGGRFEAIGEILPGYSVEQDFVPERAGLAGVAVLAANYGRVNDCTLELELVDPASGRRVARQTWECGELGNHRWIVMRFPAEAGSRERLYRLLLKSPDGRPGNAVTVLRNPDLTRSGEPLRIGGALRGGMLAFDHASNLDDFEPRVAFETHTLYQYRRSSGRFWTVGRVRVVSSESEARGLLEAGLDPGETAVISDFTPPVAEGGAGRVEVLSEDPRRLALTATRASPGLLVTTMPHFPGWRATVDGVPSPALRINYAFLGVPVPAGRSEVVLSYEPASFAWGAAVSLLGILATAALAGSGLVSARRRARMNAPGSRE